ncbi:MAG: hypothetical protein WCC04_17955 [Terriglobales bacterium]
MPPSANPKLSNGIVLCDNQAVLECEKVFLETFGYTVLAAPSGSKGLELASSHSIDVVDAFIAKDRLTSQLLPAIAQLHRFGSIPPSSYDA